MRAVIDRVMPEVDGGRFAVKRVVGETMIVEADVFADGHDALACMLVFRHESEPDWSETPMTALVNDRWRGEFPLERLGRYRYTVTAWVDHFLSWRAEFKRRVDPADIASAALVGGKLIAEAANRAGARATRTGCAQWGKQLIAARDTEEIKRIALDEEMAAIAQRYPDRRYATTYEQRARRRRRPRARALLELVRSFSALGEPRARAPRHLPRRARRACLTSPSWASTCCICRRSIRSGASSAKAATTRSKPSPGDVGSPWAIGSDEGGHKAIHPELGTLEDFAAAGRARARARASRSRSTSPSSARPTTRT